MMLPEWPPAVGEYVLGDQDSPVAVAIVGKGTVDLPTERFCIKGTFKTENFGIEKIILNVVSNPRIRFLIVCGMEEFGHFPGDALMALSKNGVGDDGRIVGCRSAVPFLCHTPKEAVDRFRRQVEVIDQVYPKEAEEVSEFASLYRFDAERTEMLLSKIAECEGRDPGPLTEEPMTYLSSSLDQDGMCIGEALNRTADRFADHMLRIPSQQFSTNCSIVVVSKQLNMILDPIDWEVTAVPSVEFATRLKNYFRGEQ